MKIFSDGPGTFAAMVAAKLCSRAAANNVLVMLLLLLCVDQLTAIKVWPVQHAGSKVWDTKQASLGRD
jgi:hypothetical protein